MLRGTSQRLSDGERSWEADKRGLEGQLNCSLHSLHESQATADQLRSSPSMLCFVPVQGLQPTACLPSCSLLALVQHLPC